MSKKSKPEVAPMKEESESPEMAKKDKKFEDYEVSGAADTIMKAHEHMADDELMKHVQPHLDKKMKAIKSIADLRKRRSSLNNSESESGMV